MKTVILDFDGTLDQTYTAIKTGKDTIKEMYAMGVILALTCNHEKKELENILRQQGVANCFSVAIAADDKNTANKDTNVFNLIADHTDSTPSQVMVVGESTPNLALGKEAGINTCMIKKDKAGKPDEADYVINDLKALLDIV